MHISTYIWYTVYACVYVFMHKQYTMCVPVCVCTSDLKDQLYLERTLSQNSPK